MSRVPSAGGGRFRLEVVRRSGLWFAVSALMVVVAAVSLLAQGLNYGIDFTGGVILDVRFARATTVGEVRQALGRVGLADSVIREVEESGGREFLVTTRPLEEARRQEAVAALRQRLGSVEVLSTDLVTPVVGSELRRAALLAVGLATLGMLVYVTFRFEWRFGVAAIVALLHDVFLTVGFFSLFRIPVDTSFVAAVLTVFGYSINDTIVVFDRIRENLGRRRREPLGQLVDDSVNQVLVRSVNTVVTTLLAVLAVFLFGGRTVHFLALGLLVGIAFGAYSSIFLASPLYVAIARRTGLEARAAVRQA